MKLAGERDVSNESCGYPNIIKIFVPRSRRYAYIVMRYFQGCLEHFKQSLPLQELNGIIFKCAMASITIARQGIVHRDIKPANILVDGHDNSVRSATLGWR